MVRAGGFGWCSHRRSQPPLLSFFFLSHSLHWASSCLDWHSCDGVLWLKLLALFTQKWASKNGRGREERGHYPGCTRLHHSACEGREPSDKRQAGTGRRCHSSFHVTRNKNETPHMDHIYLKMSYLWMSALGEIDKADMLIRWATGCAFQWTWVAVLINLFHILPLRHWIKGVTGKLYWKWSFIKKPWLGNVHLCCGADIASKRWGFIRYCFKEVWSKNRSHWLSVHLASCWPPSSNVKASLGKALSRNMSRILMLSFWCLTCCMWIALTTRDYTCCCTLRLMFWRSMINNSPEEFEHKCRV